MAEFDLEDVLANTREQGLANAERIANEIATFNFVGKLLGPKGNSLKRLQEETLTKMAILGRGSMRDKNKEEELRKQNDPKHAHLNEELHIEVNTFAPPADAYARIGHALEELKKFLVPDDNDEIRQTQLQELAYINGTPISSGAPLGRGRGRGAAPPPPIGGPPTARTLRAGLLATPGPRAITTRPGGTPVPASRSPLTASLRVGGARVPPPPMPRVTTYRPALPEAHLRTAEEGYTYDEEYEYPETFEQSEAQFYDYAHGAAVDPYDGEYAAGEAYTATNILEQSIRAKSAVAGGDNCRESRDKITARCESLHVCAQHYTSHMTTYRLEPQRNGDPGMTVDSRQGPTRLAGLTENIRIRHRNYHATNIQRSGALLPKWRRAENKVFFKSG
uniref:KHDC4/BBP-like KH-domain type I domain-containing protein n=1 Tax=Strigamia maritima TaxID=126957 RepID=T1IXP4_STRMM